MNHARQQLERHATAVPSAPASLPDLIEELTARIEAGDPVDFEAFYAEHAQYEAQLRELAPALVALADLGQSAGERAARGAFHVPTDEAGRLGDFRIVRELGRGGMGVVYEAEQISLSRRVALKVLPFAGVLDERQLKRFKLEAAAAAALKHPNIVSVFCVGCERGVHFYAIEFVEGQTLADVVGGMRNDECGMRNVARSDAANFAHPALSTPYSVPTDGSAYPIRESELDSSPFPIRQSPFADTAAINALTTLRTDRPRDFFRRVAEIGIQAAEALHHAHEMGIIHRDIKPANLLLDLEGKLYITDFGLARLSTDAGMTLTGDMLGTLRYMSPEQASGEKLLDERTDIYSLGITLYELLALQPAFDENDRQKLIRQVAEQEPPRLRAINPRIPADLETIILKAIAKDPDDRYGTARQLSTDLAQFAADKPIAARRPSLITRVHRWGRRHVAAVMALVLFLALSLTGLGVALALIFNEQTKTRDALTQAQDNLDVAAEAVDKLYANFAVEWVANETAPSNVQQEFIRLAADFYRQLVDRPGDTAQDRLMRVTAYERIGELETYLENYEDALPALEQSLKLGRRLHADFPTEVRYREALSVALYNLGIVQRALNDLDGAGDAFREALELRQLLPPTSENIERQISILLDHAQVVRQRGELEQALRLAKSAREKVTQLARQSSIIDNWRLRHVDSHFVTAGILLDLGRIDEAHNDNQNALGQCQFLRGHSLADYRPLLHNEAQLTAQAAHIADRRGQFQEAVTLYRSALDLMRQGFTAKRSPETLTMDSMARKVRDDGNSEPGPFCGYVEVQLQLADVLRRAGRPHAAEVELGSCVMTTALLVATKPRVLRYEVAAANAWAMAGDLIAADRPDEAKSAYRIAARYWLEALQRDPDAGDYRSGVHAVLKDLEYLQERLPGNVSENAASTREWGDAMGDNLFAQHARATVWFGGKSWGDSLMFAEKAAQLRKKDRAYDWLYIAMNHAHMGKHDEAQRWYDKSAEEIAAATEPHVELIELRDQAKRLLEEKRNAAAAS